MAYHQGPTLNKTNENGYSWYECACCPYGYHIDLDFVRYCESISHEVDNRTGSIKRRKDRRRQRQSMEVLLGLTPPVLAALQETYKPINEQKTPPANSYSYSSDAFDDAVSDFEKTLQRSKNKLSHNLPDVTAVSDSIGRVPSLSPVSSASGSTPPTCSDGPRHDLDNTSPEWFGMSPLALQNVRKQMALSLERTKELEDQVKQIPELKVELAHLQEENRRLLRLNSGETSRLNKLNANYCQTSNQSNNHQRSHSFTNFDNIDGPTWKKVTLPPRKDFGVMCSVLTRNVGVGHQNPNTKNVSTSTLEPEFADKWLSEKVKFLNNQNSLMNHSIVKKVTISKETQTILSRSIRDIGVQAKFELPQKVKVNVFSQTEMWKNVCHASVSAVPKYSDVSIQKCVECYSVGSSDDTVNSTNCEKCVAVKKSVGVGPDTNVDTHTSPVSLALLNSRSKSFNLGADKLNLMSRSRTVGSQYERNNVSRSCQSDIRVKSLTKSCQSELKYVDKNTQCERNSISRHTDTIDLTLPTKHVASEAKEMKPETNNVGCNTAAELAACAKCDREKEEAKGAFKKEGGSPTPSRIPRPQIPTTPVENRKFRRQDTYTKIYSSPTDKSPPTLSLSRLSGLDLSPKAISSESSPFDKVKQNFQFADVPISSVQNGVNPQQPITKVQVHEITLPSSDSTIFHPNPNQNRKKAIPSKEMQGAMKVLNDLLHKNPSKNFKNHSATNIVQQEWFKISSLVTANPLDVEDYLDVFEDMSSLLLEYVVNMSDSSGNTAMHYAVSHSNFDVVSILLDSKVCDINKQNKAGYTSVMLVSLAEVKSQTHANVVRRLFQLSDVNIRAKQHGQTALMLAVSHGHLEMVKMLLEAGADINIQDEDGSTALMCAAEHGHIDIVKHFLSQPDCDSTLMDVDGGTALKIAMEAGHKHIGVLLYAHERNLQKSQGSKLKKTKSMSPKSPLSPLPSRSNRALTDTRHK